MRDSYDIEIIPYPGDLSSFVLRLRGQKEKLAIEFDGRRYRLQTWISRTDVAKLLGVQEDYLHGVESAMKAAATWTIYTMAERREWLDGES